MLLFLSWIEYEIKELWSSFIDIISIKGILSILIPFLTFCFMFILVGGTFDFFLDYGLKENISLLGRCIIYLVSGMVWSLLLFTCVACIIVFIIMCYFFYHIRERKPTGL